MNKEQFLNKWASVYNVNDTTNPYFISDLEDVIAHEIAKAKEQPQPELNPIEKRNIWVLPTGKPSRLYEFGGKIILTSEPTVAFRNQEIYITSDEEIKERVWCYAILSKQVFRNVNPNLKSEDKKKIILTTDQDLIADGVQAIDDEFLEWFVKNPSCEKIKIEWQTTSINKRVYKIIIPKEEPKQETIEPAEQPEMTEKEKIDHILTNKLTWKPMGNNRFYANWFSAESNEGYRQVHFVDYKNPHSGYFETRIFTIDLSEWQPVDTSIKPTEQPTKPFDKERFEAMFRAVVANGGHELDHKEAIELTEEALKQLDAYYASKEGGDNG